MGGMTSCNAEPLPPATFEVDRSRSEAEAIAGMRQFELHLDSGTGQQSLEPQSIALDTMLTSDTKHYSPEYHYLVRRVQVIAHCNESNTNVTVSLKLRTHGDHEETHVYPHTIPASTAHGLLGQPHVLYVHPLFSRDELQYLPAVHCELQEPQGLQIICKTKDVILQQGMPIYMWYLLLLQEFREFLELTQKTLKHTTEPRAFHSPDVGDQALPTAIVLHSTVVDAFIDFMQRAYFDRLRYVNAEASGLSASMAGQMTTEEYGLAVQRKYSGKKPEELKSHCLSARVVCLIEYLRVTKNPPPFHMPMVPILLGNVSSSADAQVRAKTRPFQSGLEVYTYKATNKQTVVKSPPKTVVRKNLFPDDKEEQPVKPLGPSELVAVVTLGEAVNPFAAGNKSEGTQAEKEK